MEQDDNSTQNNNGSSKSDFYRTVKTYVLRQGRMTQSQERAYNELSHIWCIPYEKKQINFVDVFGNTNPIVVEIGFGMGNATVQIASQNPNINYLGLEVHKPGVGRVLSEIHNLGLKNLFLIEHDALDVLENMIPDNSLNGLHIFFPDPWPKKKHHKRRLVQKKHIELFTKKLSYGGYIYMVTDWIEYAEEALKDFSLVKGLKNKYNGFAEKQAWRPETKFEKKGLDEERVISELYFEKLE